jgi:hypothetical protein
MGLQFDLLFAAIEEPHKSQKLINDPDFFKKLSDLT